MTIPKTHRRRPRTPARRTAESDFRVEEVPMPEPRHGEVLGQGPHLADPYQRGMRDATYASPVGLGEVMTGGTGEVVASQHPDLKGGRHRRGRLAGRKVIGGMALHARTSSLAPISTANGVLGNALVRPPFSACWSASPSPARQGRRPRPARSARWWARSRRSAGCRVAGIAGGTRSAPREGRTGFDVCTIMRPRRALRAACPNGPDVYFDNVGGEMPRCATSTSSAVALCGSIRSTTRRAPRWDRAYRHLRQRYGARFIVDCSALRLRDAPDGRMDPRRQQGRETYVTRRTIGHSRVKISLA